MSFSLSDNNSPLSASFRKSFSGRSSSVAVAQIPERSTLNLINRFNRRDTHFRQPWIGRNNWHLRFGDGVGVPEHEDGLHHYTPL